MRELSVVLTPGRITPAIVRRLQLPVQVILYVGLFIAAEYFVQWLHLPLPANQVGMILMLALILCRVIPLNWVRAGARLLLAEMPLFFVPALVASLVMMLSGVVMVLAAPLVVRLLF
jgi:holin-like protein